MSAVEVVSQAFSDRQDLLQRIYVATATSNDLANLFVEVSQYINDLKSSSSPSLKSDQPSKKRKLDPPASTQNKDGPWEKGTFSTFDDLSFSIPQRKKFRLALGSHTNQQGLRVTNSSDEIETTIPWRDITTVACLPVPEKAQAQYNFCIFTSRPNNEQLLFTVPDTVPKPESLHLTQAQPSGSSTYKQLLTSLFDKALKPLRLSVVHPSKDQFHSKLPQAVRKGETAFHVKAFRGAKDGFLFLLPTGFIWGFKKPLEFFPFEVIDSVSYTSVLQRTFNLVIAVREGESEDTRELEFSMVDQADFAGIDEFVKKHSLQDASMAEERRAKKHNVNGVKKGGDGGEEEEDGEGELVKAAREAEAQGEEDDDDDEEGDVDFDPGSEGESEGSGSDTDDYDMDGGDGGGGGGGRRGRGGGKGKEDEDEEDSEGEDEDEDD